MKKVTPALRIRPRWIVTISKVIPPGSASFFGGMGHRLSRRHASFASVASLQYNVYGFRIVRS
jgi:hypothetical protein